MWIFSGYTETLDDDSEILVPDDDHGLYAIDILDPSVVMLTMILIRDYRFAFVYSTKRYVLLMEHFLHPS